MNKLFLTLIAVASGFSSMNLMAARPEMKEYTAAPGVFHSLESRISANVHLRENADSAGMVRYIADPEIAAKLRMNVTDGQLVIEFEPGTRDTDHRIKGMTVYTATPLSQLALKGSGDIKVPKMKLTDDVNVELTGSGDIDLYDCTTRNISVKVTGSGDVDLKGVTTVGTLTLRVSGSGDIDVDRVVADSVYVTVTGSGDIEMRGRTLSADYSLSGSGDISASGMISDATNVALSGSGDIECYARESVMAAASGSGSVKVLGKPSLVKVSGKKNAIKIK